MQIGLVINKKRSLDVGQKLADLRVVRGSSPVGMWCDVDITEEAHTKDSCNVILSLLHAIDLHRG